jgi:hypothetical protein
VLTFARCGGLSVDVKGPGDQMRCARLSYTRGRRMQAALRDDDDAAAADELEGRPTVQLRDLCTGTGVWGKCMDECWGVMGWRERGLKPARPGGSLGLCVPELGRETQRHDFRRRWSVARAGPWPLATRRGALSGRVVYTGGRVLSRWLAAGAKAWWGPVCLVVRRGEDSSIHITKPTGDRLLTQAVVQVGIKKFIKAVLC